MGIPTDNNRSIAANRNSNIYFWKNHLIKNAEEALCHNWELLSEALAEFGCDVNVIEEGPEWCDVTIRCYLLPEAIECVLEAVKRISNN